MLCAKSLAEQSALRSHTLRSCFIVGVSLRAIDRQRGYLFETTPFPPITVAA
jgi:hypothetical protein